MRLPFNFSFFFRHKKIYLFCVFLFFGACAFLFTRASLREDITEMLPSSLRQEMLLLRGSPLSGKIFVVIQSPREQDSRKAADIISSSFTRNADLGLSFSKTDEDFILSYYYGAPGLWNKDFEARAEKLIAPEAVKEKMEENYRILLSPAGAFMRDFIIADPLGLTGIFAEELKTLNAGAALKTGNGYIASRDGRRILLVFDCFENQLDSARSKKIGAAFDNVLKELPDGARAFMMGAARYTNENNGIIKKDIGKILIISSVLMFVLFLFFLRSRKALLVYLVPPAVMSFAGLAASFVFNGISGITIGFGSVLMGLSADYSLYMYFALKASKETERSFNAKKTAKPVLISAMTSILAFSLLYFSSIPLFKQISLFSVAGLLAALFLALCAAPFIFACENEPEKTLGKVKPFLSRPAAVIITAAFFVSAALSLKYVGFNASLDSVNTVSKQFELDKKEFEKLTGNVYGSNAFFFVFGKTAEEARSNNEKLSALNKDVLKLAALYPSKAKAEQNLAAWKSFWSGKNATSVEKEINAFAKEKGLKPEIFAPFYDFLRTGEGPNDGESPLSALYDPVIKHGENFAFVNIVPENADISLKEGIDALFISNASLQEKIVSNIIREIAVMMGLLAGGVFFVLIFWLKKVQFAVIAMLPTLCGICSFLTFSALLGIEINLFGLFAAPLLIGLAIDYGIFIIYQQKGDAKLHPAKAVLAAALSTMIGFGALMAAGHKVLFMIGFMVFTGILTAIAVSIFILPALLKTSGGKALFLPVLFVLFFSGCAGINGAGIKYNAAEPPISKDNAMTSMFYGSYKDDLNFRAIARTESDGYRIVIMSDLGVKLQDMKIKEKEDTDIYFYISYMPQETVEDFAFFFKEYYFQQDKKSIAQDDTTIYYFRKNKPVLWIRKI